jgi:adenine phosphoribosyltransferase
MEVNGKMYSDLKAKIRDVADFPKKGILFKDITTLLADPKSFQMAIDFIAHRYIDRHIDAVLGVEARGFIMGAALAYKLGSGVIIVRKPGKLPAATESVTYQLEYGEDSLEIHKDAIKPGMKILLADDVLATGGTVRAVIMLLEKMKAEIVECAFLAELSALKGREKLKPYSYFSLLSFED